MAEEVVLALDLGTSSLKCAAFSLDGKLLAVSRSPMEYHTPSGLPDLALEFDPAGGDGTSGLQPGPGMSGRIGA